MARLTFIQQEIPLKVMSKSEADSSLRDHDVDLDEKTLRHIRERVLKAEKDKLNLDNPMGINNDIEQIIEEEVQ